MHANRYITDAVDDVCKTISIYCLLLSFCLTYDYLQSISIEDFVDNPLFPLSVPRRVLLSSYGIVSAMDRKKTTYRYMVFCYFYYIYQEEFEDTKGIIRIRKWKDRQHNDQKKK